jgi:signal transduction histidine kinase
MDCDERRRIERELNQDVEQPLVLVALKLRMLQRLVPHDPLIDELATELYSALQRLREIGRRIHPVRLDYDSDLGPDATGDGGAAADT